MYNRIHGISKTRSDPTNSFFGTLKIRNGRNSDESGRYVQSTAAFNKPFFLLTLPSPVPKASPTVLGTSPPVAYSLPMLGSTFSLALNDTNRAKGTSQTHIPKYEAISVKVGISGRS